MMADRDIEQAADQAEVTLDIHNSTISANSDREEQSHAEVG